MKGLGKVCALLALVVVAGSIWSVNALATNTPYQQKGFSYGGSNYVWTASNSYDGSRTVQTGSLSQRTSYPSGDYPIDAIQAGMVVWRYPKEAGGWGYIDCNTGNYANNQARISTGTYYMQTGPHGTRYTVQSFHQFEGLGQTWYPGWSNYYDF